MGSVPKKFITLILGGARSGKSRHAQELASAFDRVVYIATASRDDAEMRTRIAKHRRERPSKWKTVEVSTGLELVLHKQGHGADLLLVDCLTIYMARMMGRKRGAGPRVRSHIQALCAAAQMTEASIIFVSNEVGCGVVPAYRSGRDYRDFLGELNQQIAGVADKVILMVAGLPLTVKDRIQD